MQPKGANTKDSDLLAEVPEEELDEFGPNDIKILQSPSQLNLQYSPSKTPDTTTLPGGITTQSMGSGCEFQIPLQRLKE